MDELRVVQPPAAAAASLACQAVPEAAVVSTTSLTGDSVYSAMVRLTRLPMLVCDPNLPDCPIVFLNSAFLRMTGYSEAEVIGRNCRFLQGPDTDPDAVRRIREAVSAREPIAITLLNHRKDGSAFWNALAISPVFHQQDRLSYFIASMFDVTEQHAAEDAARWARKMEAIGQLTAGVAHDFNNSLQVIRGNLSLARKRLAAGDQASAARSIGLAETAATASGKLTHQLLAFARRQNLAPQALDLNAVVGDFTEMLRSTVGSAAQIVLAPDPTPLPCRIDPTAAGMALLNLVMNARDALHARPSGNAEPGRITITTGRLALKGAEARAFAADLPPGRYVSFAVADNGCGMTPEVLAHAADPFFTTKSHGTGLGLSMVHGFAQQSMGRLEIRSQPEKGTTVRLVFPELTEGVAQPMPRPAEAETRETILVVDDQECVRATAADQLMEMDYAVLEAENGKQALEILEQHPEVSLVFSDVMMPGGMNGIVLAQHARRLRPDLPVLLTTGYYQEEQERGDLAHGLPILRKPYSFTALAGAIHRLLKNAAQGKD